MDSTKKECATPGGKSRPVAERVTFASALECSPLVRSRRKRVAFGENTTITIPAEYRVSPKTARQRTQALKYRRSTPHKKVSGSVKSQSPAGMKKKTRLVESGAIRVSTDMKVNPRRGGRGGAAKKHGSLMRQIDRGAVRLNVTRHTTPRRLYATRKRMWSPPPSSSKQRRVPQSEKLPNRGKMQGLTISPIKTSTPSRRSNASVGGHRFRASMSPGKCTTPVASPDLHKENGENVCLESEKGLVRSLFD